MPNSLGTWSSPRRGRTDSHMPTAYADSHRNFTVLFWYASFLIFKFGCVAHRIATHDTKRRHSKTAKITLTSRIVRMHLHSIYLFFRVHIHWFRDLNAPLLPIQKKKRMENPYTHTWATLPTTCAALRCRFQPNHLFFLPEVFSTDFACFFSGTV